MHAILIILTSKSSGTQSSREHRASIFETIFEISLGLPAVRYSVVIVALPHFTFKFASLQAESSDPNAKRVAPSISIAAVGPRIACRRTWHHERAPNLSSCALQFARCTLLSWLEAQPTRMRAVEPIAISALNGFGLGSTNLYSKVRRKLRSCSPSFFFRVFVFALFGAALSVSRLP